MAKTDGGFFSWLRKPAAASAATAPAASARPASRSASASPSQAPGHSQFLHSQSSQSAAGSTHSIRKDLLRMVLRETLVRNGIPTGWLGADILRSTTSSGREAGVHVRLLIQHWDPRLLVHGVALEQNFVKRVVAMDPLATGWLMGVSWQYAMDDQEACPPLPHPGSWTAMAPAMPPVPGLDSADVISGPVTIDNKTRTDVRAELERLMAAGDHDAQRHGAADFAPTQGPEDFAATQPIKLG